tara:strand:- start:1013 stop:1201 length:189 start_codon:yes stop_codon:yes gene_type:complete
MPRKLKIGDLVRHRLNRKKGIITGISKRNRNVTAVYVLVEGEIRRWKVFNTGSSLLDIDLLT